MAPRTAKAKKTTEVSEAPKKGRGKAKNIEEVEPEVEEQEDISEKVAPVTEKKKRGKKAAAESNGVEENEKTEETAPPAKKGRKKAEKPEVEKEIEENPESIASEEEPPIEQNEENIDTNGDAKAAPAKGRKKAAKKEPAEKRTARGRKAKDADDDTAKEEKEDVVEKPKAAGKGRGRKAQPKADTETEVEDKSDKTEEEVKPEPPPTKGRKKAQPKAVKEKSPESEEEKKEEAEESQENEEVSKDEEPDKEIEPKKKETKGKKGKKAPAKEESGDKEDTASVEEAGEAPASKKRKVNKKEEKGKGDKKEDEPIEEGAPEPKAKGRRGKKAVESDIAPADDKKKAPPKNKSITNYEELDFSNTSKTEQGKDWNFKISSWNVDGIRAWMGKGGLDYLQYEKPDILCLQETKCSQDKLPEELANLTGYHPYWQCSEKDGYAGVGVYTTQLAMNVQYGLGVKDLDNEGRIITAEYEQFYLICTYVPNAGRKLVTLPKRLQWNEEFRKYVKELDSKKPVIICGDMNVSHQEIDLANPKTNRKNAGFTDEERAGMSELLGDGFVDTFRRLYPDEQGAYTFWTYMMNCRAKNVGWRLDYFIVSERLLPSLCDNVIRDKVYGSDHCPISLFLHLKGADKPKE